MANEKNEEANINGWTNESSDLSQGKNREEKEIKDDQEREQEQKQEQERNRERHKSNDKNSQPQSQPLTSTSTTQASQPSRPTLSFVVDSSSLPYIPINLSPREKFKILIEDYLQGKISRKDFRQKFLLYKELCIIYPENGPKDRYNILHELIRKGFTRIIKEDILPLFPECVFAIEIENDDFYREDFFDGGNYNCFRESDIIGNNDKNTTPSYRQKQQSDESGERTREENGINLHSVNNVNNVNHKRIQVEETAPDDEEIPTSTSYYNPYQDHPFYSSTNLNQMQEKTKAKGKKEKERVKSNYYYDQNQNNSCNNIQERGIATGTGTEIQGVQVGSIQNDPNYGTTDSNLYGSGNGWSKLLYTSGSSLIRSIVKENDEQKDRRANQKTNQTTMGPKVERKDPAKDIIVHSLLGAALERGDRLLVELVASTIAKFFVNFEILAVENVFDRKVCIAYLLQPREWLTCLQRYPTLMDKVHVRKLFQLQPVPDQIISLKPSFRCIFTQTEKFKVRGSQSPYPLNFWKNILTISNRAYEQNFHGYIFARAAARNSGKNIGEEKEYRQGNRKGKGKDDFKMNLSHTIISERHNSKSNGNDRSKLYNDNNNNNYYKGSQSNSSYNYNNNGNYSYNNSKNKDNENQKERERLLPPSHVRKSSDQYQITFKEKNNIILENEDGWYLPEDDSGSSVGSASIHDKNLIRSRNESILTDVELDEEDNLTARQILVTNTTTTPETPLLQGIRYGNTKFHPSWSKNQGGGKEGGIGGPRLHQQKYSYSQLTNADDVDDEVEDFTSSSKRREKEMTKKNKGRVGDGDRDEVGEGERYLISTTKTATVPSTTDMQDPLVSPTSGGHYIHQVDLEGVFLQSPTSVSGPLTSSSLSASQASYLLDHTSTRDSLNEGRNYSGNSHFPPSSSSSPTPNPNPNPDKSVNNDNINYINRGYSLLGSDEDEDGDEEKDIHNMKLSRGMTRQYYSTLNDQEQSYRDERRIREGELQQTKSNISKKGLQQQQRKKQENRRTKQRERRRGKAASQNEMKEIGIPVEAYMLVFPLEGDNQNLIWQFALSKQLQENGIDKFLLGYHHHQDQHQEQQQQQQQKQEGQSQQRIETNQSKMKDWGVENEVKAIYGCIFHAYKTVMQRQNKDICLYSDSDTSSPSTSNTLLQNNNDDNLKGVENNINATTSSSCSSLYNLTSDGTATAIRKDKDTKTDETATTIIYNNTQREKQQKLAPKPRPPFLSTIRVPGHSGGTTLSYQYHNYLHYNNNKNGNKELHHDINLSLLQTFVKVYEKTGDSNVFELEAIRLALEYKWKKYGRPIYIICLLLSLTVAVNFSLFSIYGELLLSGTNKMQICLGLGWILLLLLNMAPLIYVEVIRKMKARGFYDYFHSVWNFVIITAFIATLAALTFQLLVFLPHINSVLFPTEVNEEILANRSVDVNSNGKAALTGPRGNMTSPFFNVQDPNNRNANTKNRNVNVNKYEDEDDFDPTSNANKTAYDDDYVNPYIPDGVIYSSFYGDVSLLLLSLAAMLLWSKILLYMRGFNETSTLLRGINQSMVDSKFFLLILLISIVGFTNAFYLLFQIDDTEYGRNILSSNDDGDGEKMKLNKPLQLWETFLLLFESIFGNLNYQSFIRNENFFILPSVLYVIFCIFNTIILINLLIAIMQDSYDKIRENSMGQARYEKALALLEIESMLPEHCFANPKLFPNYIQDGSLNIHSVTLDDPSDQWSGRIRQIYKKIERTEKALTHSLNLVADKLHEMREVQQRVISQNPVFISGALGPEAGALRGKEGIGGRASRNMTTMEEKEHNSASVQKLESRMERLESKIDTLINIMANSANNNNDNDNFNHGEK